MEVFAPAAAVQRAPGPRDAQRDGRLERWAPLEHLGPDHLVDHRRGVARAARLDTHRHIGDPDVVAVPIERLLGAARTEALRAEMRARLDAARRPVAVAGGSGGDAGASTTHLAAMDASGLAVNVTQSLGNGFGSGIVVPGTGICLNNALHWTQHRAGPSERRAARQAARVAGGAGPAVPRRQALGNGGHSRAATASW